jgi:undecaprenol kinase
MADKEQVAVKQPKFWKSLAHAWNGLCFTVRTQRNARIHLVVATVVIGAAVWLQVKPLPLGVLLLTIGAVFAGETINTTVEAIVDLLSPEWHERAKIAKDAAAGAVLILSLTAIAVGLCVLGPPLWERFFSGELVGSLSQPT